jgi:hypothetical protein
MFSRILIMHCVTYHIVARVILTEIDERASCLHKDLKRSWFDPYPEFIFPFSEQDAVFLLCGLLCNGHRNGLRLILESRYKIRKYMAPVMTMRGIQVAMKIQKSGET